MNKIFAIQKEENDYLLFFPINVVFTNYISEALNKAGIYSEGKSSKSYLFSSRYISSVLFLIQKIGFNPISMHEFNSLILNEFLQDDGLNHWDLLLQRSNELVIKGNCDLKNITEKL